MTFVTTFPCLLYTSLATNGSSSLRWPSRLASWKAPTQIVPATTVPGDTATVTVDTEGPTVLTFFATDQLDNQEAAQTITINIDKTPPAIVGARAGNTARFTCADDLSGIAFCTGPTRLPGGANPRVTGTAEDFAGNSATANVAGSGSGGAGSCATAAPTTLPAAELLYPCLLYTSRCV